MKATRQKKTEYIGFTTDLDLRTKLETEAARRDASVASVVRALVRAQLVAQAKQQSAPAASDSAEDQRRAEFLTALDGLIRSQRDTVPTKPEEAAA